MNVSCPTTVWLLATALVVSRASAAHDLGRIDALIDQLGSDQFVVRQRAEVRLIEQGADAFDALQAAEHHPDLEIAARAEYILHQIQIEWTRPSDSPDVRRVMARYGELSLDQRRQRIAKLADFPDSTGHAALARIARYDASPRLARHAALAILSEEKSHAIAEVIDEIGDSQRAPIEWLRVFADQLERPDQLDPRWLRLLDVEVQLLADDAEDNDVSTLFQLLNYHLELGVQASDAQAIFATLQRRTDLLVELAEARPDLLYQVLDWSWSINQLIFRLERAGGAKQAPVAYATAWTIDHRQWEVQELLEDHYRDAFKNDRLAVYLSAVAKSMQSRPQVAEKIAARAFRLETGNAQLNNALADVMAEFGRHDWAEREWLHVVDDRPAIDIESIRARKSLADSCLHDRGENLQAAELLAESCDALDADHDEKRRLAADATGRYVIKTLNSRREFFRACDAESRGQFGEQRDHLEKSFKINPIDADVLIAMYHLQDSDDAYRKKVVGRIVQVSQKLDNDVKRDRQDANTHNHWAWLISNTEGDFQKALRYSERSLELSPGSPSYLDTLARCYYAVDDLENALKYQREAIQRHPQLQVMQRQLELFERKSQE